MVLDRPCDKKHDFNKNYLDSGQCAIPYRYWSESHCLRCGFYIVECGCHFCDSVGKISWKTFRKNMRKTGLNI